MECLGVGVSWVEKGEGMNRAKGGRGTFSPSAHPRNLRGELPSLCVPPPWNLAPNFSTSDQRKVCMDGIRVGKKVGP